MRDGGNCFNLNSVVEGDPRTALVRRPSGVAQFAGLMMALDVPEADARRIAEAAADWADSDADARPGRRPRMPPMRPARRPTAPATPCSPIRASCARSPAMTPALYRRLRPWLCALPVSDLSPINLNTLLPEQAPLLAMLAPGQLERRAGPAGAGLAAVGAAGATRSNSGGSRR